MIFINIKKVVCPCIQHPSLFVLWGRSGLMTMEPNSMEAVPGHVKAKKGATDRCTKRLTEIREGISKRCEDKKIVFYSLFLSSHFCSIKATDCACA